jgi:hypothetical protein
MFDVEVEVTFQAIVNPDCGGIGYFVFEGATII